MIRVPKATHTHTCDCGAVLACAALADQCAVRDPWQCPRCEQDQRDEYFRDLEPLLEQRRALKAVPTIHQRRKHA